MSERSQHRCGSKDEGYIARWPIRVYFEDTDAGGIVYHASYVALYEWARTKMLRQMALNQQYLKDENIASAVRRINVEYLAVARLDD